MASCTNGREQQQGRRPTKRLLAIALLLMMALASPAFAAITTGGDPGETSWSPSTATVGCTAGKTGTLMIDVGTNASTSYCWVGTAADSTGLVSVTGNPSKLTVNLELYVGQTGNGTISVDGGGYLSARTAYLGYDPGSSGSAAVTGTGSTWSGTSLYVGYKGAGTFTVGAGATVTATSLWASASDLKGEGTISVKGLVADADVTFDAAHPASTSVPFGTGGTLTVTPSSAVQLGAGYHAAGSLTISEGAKVTSRSGMLGYWDNSVGTAVITGVGSSWTTASGLTIGNYGTGTVRVEEGASVSCSYAWLGGNSPTSSGTVLVSGPGSSFTSSSFEVGSAGTGTFRLENGASATTGGCTIGGGAGSSAIVTGGSRWVNSDNLSVGDDYQGPGSLTVEDGGVVDTASLSTPLGNLKGNGTINTRGLLSNVDLTFDAAHGTSLSLPFGTGGTLNLTPDETGVLGVGCGGSASLKIADGVKINSWYSWIGYSAGSPGLVLVTGPGSTWTISDSLTTGEGSGSIRVENGGKISTGGVWSTLRYGSSAVITGTGSAWTSTGTIWVWSGSTLRVEDGGCVESTSLYASLGDISGNGTIRAKGFVPAGDLVFDAAHGANPCLDFGSGGKLLLTPDGTGDIGAGFGSPGTLTIADGIKVSSNHGYVGYGIAYRNWGKGTAIVTGAGSEWTTNELDLGMNAESAMSVLNGARVTAQSTWMYDGGGSITVSGAGSTLSTGYFYDMGGGTLRVQNGGSMVSGDFYGYASHPARAVVSGPGSKWSLDGSIYIPSPPSGPALVIADGGKVAASSCFVESGPALQIRVSGNGMLTLGSASQTGYMNNAGAVTFCADPFLAAGTYSPITEYAGRAMTWSGTGTYNALGGTWKNTAKTFIVVGPTALAAGVVRGVSSGERVLVTDSFSGQRVGASFGTVNTGVTFSAACTPAAELASLTPTAGEALLSAWDFTANFTSGSSLLAFDVGRGVTDVNVWHCDGSTWTLLDPVDLIYSSGGIVSFTASVFGDYAIVGGHTLAGDANGDGKVSFADYLVLESNFGKSGTTWAQGDFNNDAKVSFADYVLLESNFDKSVPEPLTVALLLVGGLGIRRRG